MADIDYCEACDTLREIDPGIVANGFTDRNCTNLRRNKGLGGDSDNCTDLNVLNDCLMGGAAEEAELSDICDWREYMTAFAMNVWTVFKALICAVCGIYDLMGNVSQEIRDIDVELAASSYLGIMTLYTSSRTVGNGSTVQSPPFNMNSRQGNIPPGILKVKTGYNGIVVQNTTDVPLLVETTFNCSIETDQNFCCCYILVMRDGKAVGQTPFITPDTYDQQVMAEPFILRPGQSAEMTYAFRIGSKNSWFRSQFGGGTYVRCALDEVTDTQRNQRSYFSVRVTSAMNASVSN